MHWCVSIGTAAAVATLLCTDVPSVASPGAAQMGQGLGGNEVDVELVLAVDVSYSMDLEELALQREGYAQALVSPEFLNALNSGLHRKVALTYFEWSTAHDQKVIIPWRVVDGPEAADAISAEILKVPLRRASRTSISGAINYGVQLLHDNPFQGLREVIDVSGDGPNNSGEPVTVARDEALRRGITINGLPLMLKAAADRSTDIDKLDVYYEDCVIGGAGSFILAVRERAKFKDAIRAKLVLEVSGIEPPADLLEAQERREPRVSCTVGEQIWRDRWRR